MKAQEIVSSEVYCASPSDTVSDVAQQMKRHNIGFVPICEKDRLVGVVTDRDITLECLAGGLDPRNTQVRQFMMAKPVTVNPEMDVKDCAEIMAREQVRRLPVVSHDGKLIGVISLGDIAVALQDDHLVAETLRRISVPVRGAAKPAAEAA